MMKGICGSSTASRGTADSLPCSVTQKKNTNVKDWSKAGGAKQHKMTDCWGSDPQWTCHVMSLTEVRETGSGIEMKEGSHWG